MLHSRAASPNANRTLAAQQKLFKMEEKADDEEEVEEVEEVKQVEEEVNVEGHK